MVEIIPKTMREPISQRVYLMRLVIGILIINLFVVGLAAYSLYQSRQLYESRVVTQTQNLSNSLNLTISSIIGKSIVAVFSVKKEMQRQLRDGKVDGRSVDEYILDQKKHISELDGLRVTDSQGEIIYGDRVDPVAHVSFADRDVFVWARNDSKTDFFVGPPVFGRISKQWVFHVAARINNPDGTFAGTVFGAISLDYLAKIVSTIDLGKLGNITLRYSDYTVMLRYPDPSGKSSIGSKTVSKELRELVEAEQTSGTYTNPGSIDSIKRVFSFSKVANYPLYAIAGLATKEYLAPWRTEVQQMLSMVLLFSSGTAVATWLLYRNRTRSIITEVLTVERNYLHTLFEHNGSGHLIVSPTREILQVNHFFCEMFGYSEAELVGQSTEILHLDRQHYEGWAPLFKEARDGQTRTSAEYPWCRKDGSIFWCIFTGVKLQLPSGETGVVWSVIDITERKQADEALRTERQFLMDIIDFLPDATFVIDKDHQIVAWNRAAETITGIKRDELIGNRDYAYSVPFYGELRPILIDLLDSSDADNAEAYSYVKRMGTTICAESFSTYLNKGQGAYLWGAAARLYDKDGNYAGAIEVVRDVTVQKQTEEEKEQLLVQLSQSQKMESIGRLAGGVAHDFNNLLTPILGYAELFRNSLLTEKRDTTKVDSIIKAADKARILTQQLLSFGRKQILDIKVINVNDVITSFSEIMRRTVRENIDIQLHLTNDNLGIKADKNQLEQILMNLAVNAQDAIENNGTITIETTSIALDEEYARQHAGVTPGRYLMLVVSDSGCGMDQATISQIFEPFFTTKGIGEGSGLGLATVYGLVKQHEGHIWVYSEKGKGSAFKLFFPLVDERPLAEVEIVSEHIALQADNRTIMLVEDNDMVRDLVHDLLVGHGFTILVAAEPKQALLMGKDKHLDLLVTDVIMPDMKGPELHKQLLNSHPGLKVLYMSGYTDNVIAHHGVLEQGINFIQKPFAINALAKKIEVILRSEIMDT